jgi:3',5'-cyclic AMP phosphodiesterase CpdA
VRILQLSDIHFGRHAVPAYHAAVLRRVAEGRYDAVALVGDLTQRNRSWQFRRAAAFCDEVRRHAKLLVVAGNHDTAWWWKPVGVGLGGQTKRAYRKWISHDLEPRLSVPGVTFVGLDSCHGVQPYTLTTRLRDLSVVGVVRPEQWSAARAAFDAAPAGDLKVLVFHHNLLRGDLSQRWGLVARAAGIRDAHATGADVVLNGHDHQTRIESVELDGRAMVVSHSTSFCSRTRGGLAAAFQEIEVERARITLRACVWDREIGDFSPRQDRIFPR